MNHIALLVVVAGFRVSALEADTFIVTTTADAGPSSLRQAIWDANATNGLDVITLHSRTGVHRSPRASALRPSPTR